jgi:hypothetical protein
MTTQRTITSIVCETYEDYIVFYESGEIELVSVKHRDPSQGAWTLATLSTDGGLKHLLVNWLRSERTARCRLQTNGGMKTGRREAAHLASACRLQRNDELEEAVVSLKKYLGPIGDEDIRTFLEALLIEDELPNRNHITDSNLEQLMRPALERLGLDKGCAGAAYKALVSRIEEASRAGARTPHKMLHSLASTDQMRESTTLRVVLEKRTLTREVILPLLQEECGLGGTLLRSSQDHVASSTALVKKLRAGGLEETAINSAKRLRLVWSTCESQYSDDLPGYDDEMSDLRTRVLEIVATVIARVKKTGVPYGDALRREVKRAVKVAVLSRKPAFPLDDHHLLGLVYQLTDECEVWWSEPFQLDFRTWPVVGGATRVAVQDHAV